MNALRPVLAALLFLACQAGEPPRGPAQAVASGLAWLRSQQQPDGGMGGRYPTASTALATLAHLAAGITPDLPEHGPGVRRMLARLTSLANERGYLGGEGSRMYGHGLACLALANALGATRDDDLDERLRLTLTRGIAVTIAAARIAKSDANQGGWHYDPDGGGSDLSVTGWQLASLYAARRTGLTVPDDVFGGALAYVRRLIDTDGKVGYTHRGEDRNALRGLALFALDLEAGPRDPLRDRIVARMLAEPTIWSGPWFFYRVYYDATGLSRCEPATWAAVRDPFFAMLVANQGKDATTNASMGRSMPPPWRCWR